MMRGIVDVAKCTGTVGEKLGYRSFERRTSEFLSISAFLSMASTRR